MLMFMKEVKRKYLKMSNKIYVGWNEIEELVDDLCYHISCNHPNIKYVHGLKRGGLIPAVMISHTLGLEYVDTPHFYHDECLIVDDMCDSGVTLEKWNETHITAVLHYKPHTACVEPTIHAFTHKGDEWIIYPWERDDSETIQDYLK